MNNIGTIISVWSAVIIANIWMASAKDGAAGWSVWWLFIAGLVIVVEVIKDINRSNKSK